MDKTITDFCPVSNCDKSIRISYIDCSTFNEHYFVKHRYTQCEHCNAEKCPLFINATQIIN